MHCPKGEPASFAVEFSLMACRTDRKFFFRIRPNSVDSRDSNPDLRNHLKVLSGYANNPTVPRESMPRNRTLHINQSLLQRLRPACTFGVRGTPLYFLTPPQAGPGALLSLLSGVTPRVLPLNCGPRVTPHSCGLGTQFFLFSVLGFSVPFYSAVFSSGSPFPSILRFSLRVLRSLLFCGSRVLPPPFSGLLWP